MTCHIKDRTRWVAEYLDGTLGGAEREKFEEHVFECDLCFQELLFQQETAKVIQQEGERLIAPEKQPLSVISKLKMAMQNLIPNLENPRLNHVFVYAALLLMVVIGGYFTITKLYQDEFPYNFENQVPYKFFSSQLRGRSTSMEIDPNLDVFIRNFQAAIGDYNIFEYESAAKIFKRLEPLAELLIKESDEENRIRWIKDYYFYRALSHLAIGTNKKLDKEQKQKNLDMAIENIRTAIKISKKYNLNDNARENYFMLLAYLAKGDKEQAESTFKKIPESSAFREKAKKALHK